MVRVTGGLFVAVGFAALALPLSQPTRAAAAPCSSWNLYSDFKTSPSQANPNPDSCANAGVWFFEKSVAAVHDPSQYALLPAYTDNFQSASGLDGWFNAASSTNVPLVLKNTNASPATFATVTVPGNSVVVHPGSEANSTDGFYVVVGWKSPIAGSVSISGGVSSDDNNGGNGIIWSIDTFKGSTNTTITGGQYGRGGAQLFANGTGGASSISGIAVSPGDFLYFVIDPNVDYTFDSTDLDVTITASPQTSVAEAPWGPIALGAVGLIAVIAWVPRRARKAAEA